MKKESVIRDEMQILDIINRIIPPRPWTEGDNVDWNNLDFSKRMLKEHLAQDHNHASRQLAS